MVDLGADAAITNAGVDRIGEIQRCPAARQLYNRPFRREGNHLVGVHFQLDMFEEIIVRLVIAKPFGEGFDPFGRINRKRVRRGHAIAVGPMRRNACFCDLCIWWVRICTSTRLPSRPETVVWIDRYPLDLGWLM